MAGTAPSILVIADDGNERELIVSTLGEAGFAVATTIAIGAAEAAGRERFATAIVALVEHDAAVAMAELRELQPALPLVLVVDAAARGLDEGGATVVKRRPLDPRRLLGCVVELVLRADNTAATAPRHSTAAELGIATARLACLRNRHSVAAATGAARLAQDLKRQIGEVRSTCRGLAAAGDFAVQGCPG